jgi:hypothetical protein
MHRHDFLIADRQNTAEINEEYCIRIQAHIYIFFLSLKITGMHFI